jgi:hypothetical protein
MRDGRDGLWLWLGLVSNAGNGKREAQSLRFFWRVCPKEQKPHPSEQRHKGEARIRTKRHLVHLAMASVFNAPDLIFA